MTYLLNRISTGLLAAFVVPAVSLAATTNTSPDGKSFHDLVYGPIMTLGNQIINLMYALAFVAFLIGMVRYVLSHDAEKRQQGKSFAIWSFIGLVVIFSVWGLVRVMLQILTNSSV